MCRRQLVKIVSILVFAFVAVAYIDARPGALADRPVSVAHGGLATPFLFEQEAEAAPLTLPMAVGEDENASGGQYIYCPIKGEAGETAKAVFTIEVPVDDDYYLWARMMGVAWPNNSFYVSWDGGAEFHCEIPPLLGEWDWRWDIVHRADNPPQTFRLGPGTHTLTFRAREHNARLDKVVLTDDPDYRPAGASVSEPFIMYQREAESASLTGPMAIHDDIFASDCRYVSAAVGPSEGAVSLTLDVFAQDQYYLWGRAMGVGYTHNSFFVSVDGGPELHYEVPMLEGQWRWTWEAVRPEGEPLVPITLTRGIHTFRFRARESDSRLDVIVLLNDPSLIPAGITPCPVIATPTVTATPQATPTASETPTPSVTPMPSETPTASPTATVTPSATTSPTPWPTHPSDRRLWLPMILS